MVKQKAVSVFIDILRCYINGESLKKEHERTSKEKDDIIREQKEKLAEYEAIFEALKKKRVDLEKNRKHEVLVQESATLFR